jgi:hypothetical protein
MNDEALVSVSELVGMKNWDDEKQCWIGVICQIVQGADGKESIHVFDVERADTQVEIDDWIVGAIKTKPWEKNAPAS